MKEIENELVNKIRRRWMKLRLQPILVFCFHQVSDIYNPLTTWECDWTQTEQLKNNICWLKSRYTFVSLPEAHKKIKNNKLRFRKYAVLTADDGYRSLLNVLPWFEEQKIPITLFVNTKYLDKHSWSDINEKQAIRTKPDVDMLSEVCPDLYLSWDELFELDSPLVTIGLHGHEHLDATRQFEEDFRENVEKCKDLISSHPRFIPFFAYTWGRRNVATDKIVKEMDLVPVLVNGKKNYNDGEFINRICIDGKIM